MYTLFLIAAVVLATITIIAIFVGFSKTIKETQQSTLNAFPYPVFGIDSNQSIVLINISAMKLLEKNENSVKGHPIDALLPIYQDGALQTFEQYHTKISEDIINEQFTIALPNTSKKQPVHLSLRKLGTTNISILILSDASEEKELEAMKVDFVSMAAHELRTPLTAIRGYTSLLQMHYGAKFDDAAKEVLNKLLISTGNLTNLIDNLLSVSRIERKSMGVEARPLDIVPIVKEIVQTFEQQAKTRKQTFSIHIPDKLPPVMIDPFRIGQVLINLISNAINYTPEGGSVDIAVSDDNSSVIITVKDTGEGIPQEAMPHLFTKFFRVSGSLEQGSKGTGLGLYITKSIVEMHNGKIWAESEMGKGSTFAFSLPHASDEQKMATQQQSSPHDFLTVKNAQGIIVRKSTNNQVSESASQNKQEVKQS